MKVPQLQSFGNNIFDKPFLSTSKSGLFALIQAAKELDQELANWTSSMPTDWLYSAAKTANSMAVPEFLTSWYIPDEIHKYPDFYIARVWNLYRVSRIIVQSVLFRALSHTNNSEEQPQEIHVKNIIGSLVSDICASVPFLLSYDLSQLKIPLISIAPEVDAGIWPQYSASIKTESEHTGRFSLIWPLYLSCSVPSIPEIQRHWMRAQLEWIAECGEPQAALLLGMESQTLYGRPEGFRFDCV